MSINSPGPNSTRRSHVIVHFDDVFRTLLVDVAVLGHSEANLAVLLIVHGVKLCEERDTEHEEWSVWWGNVQRHEVHAAIRTRLVLVDVVLRLQVQNVPVVKLEAKQRQAVEVGAVVVHVESLLDVADHVGGPRELRGARVHGDVTILAKIPRLVVDGNILDLNLPIPCVTSDILPDDVVFAEEKKVRLVRSKSNLGLLVILV